VVGVRVAEALLERLRRAGDESAEALAATFEVARALAERVQGLQITTVHGSPQTAERLLAQIMQRLPQVAAAQSHAGPATKARHG
jgi:hypothetical protein